MREYFFERTTPLKVDYLHALMGLLGGFTVIYTLLLLTKNTEQSWIIAPFGASCVLVFVVWDSPLSQPRNVIGGYVISTFIGLPFSNFIGNSEWHIALSVGCAIAVMHLTKTTHPPAGADPLVVLLGSGITNWSYMIFPVLLGSVVIVLIGILINGRNKKRTYPSFWV